MSSQEPALHGKKISEVFQDYVEPIIESLKTEQPNASLEEYDFMLRVPWMAWNAVVLKELEPNKTDYLNMMDQILIGQSPMVKAMVEFWVERKRKEFSKYKYLLGEYRSYKKENGDLYFFAEARSNNLDTINRMAMKFQ